MITRWLWVGMLIVACGAAEEPPSEEMAPSAQCDEATCRALDSADLSARVDAMHRLEACSNEAAREGGTEQRMEAMAAFCERTYGITCSWMPTR